MSSNWSSTLQLILSLIVSSLKFCVTFVGNLSVPNLESFDYSVIRATYSRSEFSCNFFPSYFEWLDSQAWICKQIRNGFCILLRLSTQGQTGILIDLVELTKYCLPQSLVQVSMQILKYLHWFCTIRCI